MNIIQIILLSIIADKVIQIVFNFLMWRKLDNCEEMLEDAEDRYCTDARAAEQLQRELDKIYGGSK